MRFSLLIGFLIGYTVCLAQPAPYPTNYFRNPLDLNPSFAGLFGDLRPNHFHSGLDFRTNQREGYPVYAAADGYISRLRVQAGGFGQCIYINHPNGFTTVYAHLSAFNPAIAKTVKDFQYGLKSFEIDVPFIFSEIPVKKGELIGWSGNTGSSGGPHLHFEVRDTQTEQAINPQLCGFTVPDKVRPEIKGIYIYRLNGQNFNEQTLKQYYAVKPGSGFYQLLSNEPIILHGESAFGLVAIDRTQAQGGSHGLYQIELSLDDSLIYKASWERLSFDANKAINAHLDYPALKNSGINIHKTFVEPGNPLGIYQSENRGLLNIKDEAIHLLTYRISDVAGNVSVLNFKVKNGIPVQNASYSNNGIVFNEQEDNHFGNDQFRVELPKGSLYSPINFQFASAAALPGAYSKQFRIHKATTPLHLPGKLIIKAEPVIPEKLQNKALIVDARGVSQGGEFKNGNVSCDLKYFGTFYIKVDTIAPKITPVNINDGKIMTGNSKIIFKIADALSGIDTFTGKIDGQWVLMEYDQKSNTLWHRFDERTPSGKHELELIVYDKKANQSVYKASFTL